MALWSRGKPEYCWEGSWALPAAPLAPWPLRAFFLALAGDPADLHLNRYVLDVKAVAQGVFDAGGERGIGGDRAHVGGDGVVPRSERPHVEVVELGNPHGSEDDVADFVDGEVP